MKRIKIYAALCGLMLSASVFSGCGDSKESKIATKKDAVATDKVATDVVAVTATPSPTIAPTEVPVDLPYEETWKYNIVVDGYYNAAAKWDKDGKLTGGPSYTAGENIYYNDCDEYYNNFVAATNTYGGAALTLDDEYAHSSDNSVKITSRKENTKGFSGFALYLNESNALDIKKLAGKEVTIGMWVYYNDSFAMGVASELNFTIWSNLNPEADKANEVLTKEPKYDEATKEMTPEEKEALKLANEEAKATYLRFHEEEQKANKEGFYKLTSKSVAYEKWTYIEVTTEINTKAEKPCIVLATLGEKNNDNVTFYNQFYVDDIYVKLNK